MKSYSRELFMKILLILVSEGFAIILTGYINDNIVVVPHTTLSSIVCGAALAIFVVTMYDRWMKQRKKLVTEELRCLTDAALMRYHVNIKEDEQYRQ